MVAVACIFAIAWAVTNLTTTTNTAGFEAALQAREPQHAPTASPHVALTHLESKQDVESTICEPGTCAYATFLYVPHTRKVSRV